MDTKRIKDTSKALFSDRIWTLDLDSYSTGKRRFFKLVKLVRIVLVDFAKKRMGFQCVALSYFCAMALIPLLAVIFAVTGGLGLTDKIFVLLYNVLPNNPELVGTLMEQAANIIDVAKSGVVGAISALTFLWTIMWMMFQVERVFNNVWGIQKVPRKIYKRFSFYLLTIFLLPFILVTFGFALASYANVFTLLGLSKIKELGFLTKFLGWLGLYIFTVFTLSAMYKFIPAAKVRYRCAFTAALVSGAFFVVFQYLYLQTQMFVTKLNGVYGAIAAVPLFLIWLNYSWQIVIYGAQLSFAIQHIDTYNISDDITFKEAFIEDAGRHSKTSEEDTKE